MKNGTATRSDLAEREHLEAYAENPSLESLRPRRWLMELIAFPEDGLIRNLGVVLRG